MTKEEFIGFQKECDKRFMDFIENDWSFISSLNEGDCFSVPADCIAPDTIGEWIDAKVNGMRDSNINKPIEVHIGYGEILTVRDGHNRLKTILSKNTKELIKVIFKGTR